MREKRKRKSETREREREREKNEEKRWQTISNWNNGYNKRNKNLYETMKQLSLDY